MSFSQLGLAPELLHAVADQGYTEPTPVQREAIPLVLAGRDLLAGAQTGTGKTAAFVLPMLQLLGDRPVAGAQPLGDRRNATRPPVRALILTPTRELALQVEESVRTYGARRRFRSAVIYGGVGFEPQVRALRAGPPIVVATPGRLLDHAGQGTIDLSMVEILVLDEADRMLDMGFIRDIRRILALLPARRQNLLFSATFSNEIRRLADGLLDRPATVQVTPRNTATALVTQLVHPVDRERKRELLSHLIRSGRIDQALVFTRTKHGANRLAQQLERDGIAATAIHGNKSQGQRVKALGDFKNGRASILVATEVASRGLDIEELPHVVNYELPMVAEDYVHRIGRTGRAGSTGDAISLVCVDEAPLLREIERLLGHPIPTELVAGFEPDRSIRPEPIRQRSSGGGRAGPGPRPGHPRPRPAGEAPARRPAGGHERRGGHPRQAPAGVGFGNRPRPDGGRTGAPSRPRHDGRHAAPSARPVHGRPQRAADGPARHPIAMPGERLARVWDRPD
ncbi:MAG TPA: DEAD/DEAH box helicase [Candidatus Limnocylindrales bacterium]|nr:DEAD/DEAH box helicase [Candidatus Limnocylindrales bacterium]